MYRKNICSPSPTVLFTEWNAASIPGATKKMTFTAGLLTLVELFKEPGMTTKLFEKALAYDGSGVLQTVTLTRQIDSATAVKSFFYDAGVLSRIELS